jgi:F-box interacting protein
MPAHLPFEIQVEIIKRVLRVKSLIRFRSVSKQWKSLIDSSEFINDHSVNQNHQHHLLLRYRADFERKYVSIVDDNSFPQHKLSLTVSPIVKLVSYALMLDCSHGLVCLYGLDRDRKKLIVIWNPSIRKSVGILLSGEFTALGFGVCPKTSDPKIVKITRISTPCEMHIIGWKVEVFTLSSGVWRSISMNMQLPLKRITFNHNQVVVDGAIHWIAYDSLTGLFDMIVSFDSTSEEFEQLDLPDSLAHENLGIYKFKESLAVVDWDEFEMVCDVWMMIKNGDLKSSFAKLFTVSCEDYHIIGFRKNGQLVREHISEDDDSLTTLEVYDPSTKHISDLGICETYASFFRMPSYTESLLLLNHSDSIIQG